MHVVDDRQKILHHLNWIGAAFLQLTDVRTEFEVTRVDGNRVVVRRALSAQEGGP